MGMLKRVMVLVVLAVGGVPALAQERMGPIPPDKRTPEQSQAVDEHVKARGGSANRPSLGGPYDALLRSPALIAHIRRLSDYTRSGSSLPPTLSELVVLIVAREWSQPYVWSSHYDVAIKAGLGADIARAIGEGRRPQGMGVTEEALYDFSTELLRNRGVSDATYARAVARVGERGILDAIAVAANYTWVSMIVGTARTAVPPEAATTLKRLPQ
jgi:4-carboxymuconolactone decarboxylase